MEFAKEIGSCYRAHQRDKLTTHFTWGELCPLAVRSAHLPVTFYDRLMRVALVLEALRTRFGRPIRVTSGYRNRDQNAACGGAENSKHMHGRAVDFRDWHGDNGATETMYNYLSENWKELGVGGLGWYPRTDKRQYARIHMDVRHVEPGQMLKKWVK